MTIEEILQDIISRDTHKVWGASCEIISNAHNYEKIKPLVNHLPLIKEKTINLNMGGAFAPNQRFIDFAIKIIEFYKEQKECPCSLYTEKYKLTNDVVDRELQHESFNPKKEEEKGNVRIINTVLINEKWIDYYLVECLKCQTQFKVKEREGHYMFWYWSKDDKKTEMNLV